MKLSRVIALIVFVASCNKNEPAPAKCPPQVECPPAAATAPAPSATDAVPPGNAVQTEMRLLTKMLEATVRSIGNGDVRDIAEKIHQLHGAKEATTAAVTSGAYKLPKNSENVAAFTAMDDAFHEHLGALFKASRANDVPAAAEALGQIVRGCDGCHATFRMGPVSPGTGATP